MFAASPDAYVRRMKLFASCSMAAVMGVAAVLWVGPVGAASAEEQPAPGVRSASADADADYAASVTFRIGAGMALGKPTTGLKQRAEAFVAPEDVGGYGAGFRFAFNKWDFGEKPSSVVDVAWPILQGKDRAKTDLTVSARIEFEPTSDVRPGVSRAPQPPHYECYVKDAKGQVSSRIHCWMERHGLDKDWDLHLTDDDLNRRAEVSGSFRTEGLLSLEDGKYTPGPELYVKGAPAVRTGQSTQFDAVRGRNESPVTMKVAKMDFDYTLFEDGQPVRTPWGTKLSVVGSVSNDGGGFWFMGQSDCYFKDEHGRRFDDPRFSCAMNSKNAKTSVKDGRINYITDFVVSRNKADQ
jgi:hypothetical protein